MTPDPRAAAAAAEEIAQIRWLRRVMMVEGATLVLLLLVAVPAKHLLGYPEATRLMGPVHGAAFAAYAWTLVAAASGGGWRMGEVARLALAAFVPFGALANGGLLRRKETALQGPASAGGRGRMTYLWLKALHVAAVLVWVGGLLLQSVVVAEATRRTSRAEATRRTSRAADGLQLIAAVRSWDRRVTLPALILVWALGVAVAAQGGWFRSGWLQAKLVLVVLLSGLHAVQAGVLRRSAAPGPGAPTPALGWTPVAAVLSVLAIALLAVAKPF